MKTRQWNPEEVEEYRRWQSLTDEQKIAERTEQYKDELDKNSRCSHRNLELTVYQCKYDGPKVTATFGYCADYLHIGVCVVCNDCGKSWDLNSVEATITG